LRRHGRGPSDLTHRTRAPFLAAIESIAFVIKFRARAAASTRLLAREALSTGYLRISDSKGVLLHRRNKCYAPIGTGRTYRTVWPSGRSLAAAARLLIGIANAGTDMRLHSAAPATILMARAFMGHSLLAVVPVP